MALAVGALSELGVETDAETLKSLPLHLELSDELVERLFQAKRRGSMPTRTSSACLTSYGRKLGGRAGTR